MKTLACNILHGVQKTSHCSLGENTAFSVFGGGRFNSTILGSTVALSSPIANYVDSYEKDGGTIKWNYLIIYRNMTMSK